MTGLQISANLTLPVDFVTKTAAILAQRRKGKTYTASVFAEEFVEQQIPFVALDPTGAWWGLRAAANGRDAGLPVVVIGGQHGQLPLDPSAGRFIADLVLDRPGFYVLDLSLLDTKQAERTFAYAFADRLYRKKKQAGMNFPLHLFVDECDMFVPQERESGDNLMLGAFQSIVRRGGLHGLGTTLISQRPALVNKSVLTQLDMLILLRLVAGNDQDYVDKNYVKRAGTPEERDALMTSLTSLGLGEAWIWEPGAEPPLFDRVQIRERRTFNSSATPKAGETRVEPKKLAQVDIAAIEQAMAATIEKAKADDPRALRARIRDLEQQLAKQPEPATVTVPVLSDADRELVEAFIQRWDTAYDDSAEIVNTLNAALRRVDHPHIQTPTNRSVAPTRVEAIQRGSSAPGRPRQSPGERITPGATTAGSSAGTAGNAPRGPVDLGKTERRILSVLVQHGPRTHKQLALQSGYSAKASTIGVALSKLRKAGYVEPGQPITATDDGMLALGDFEPLPTGQALLDYWRRQFGKTESLVLDALIEAYPGEMNQADVAARTGYSPTASTIGVAMSKLRKVEIVDRWSVSDDFARSIGIA